MSTRHSAVCRKTQETAARTVCTDTRCRALSIARQPGRPKVVSKQLGAGSTCGKDVIARWYLPVRYSALGTAPTVKPRLQRFACLCSWTRYLTPESSASRLARVMHDQACSWPWFSGSVMQSSPSPPLPSHSSVLQNGVFLPWSVRASQEPEHRVAVAVQAQPCQFSCTVPSPLGPPPRPHTAHLRRTLGLTCIIIPNQPLIVQQTGLRAPQIHAFFSPHHRA
jgi:hypothetical protein